MNSPHVAAVPTSSAPVEKPKNGIAGLKHLRHDILSGVVVSLVSLPLSSGIAIASGVPPIYGLISAIIAGLIFPLIGGAYVTIAGPAAGLAPALLAIQVALGGVGNATGVGAGYHHLLVVIFMVGCLQVLMALFRLARYSAMIPASVVEGMLASIGLLIIVKQLPMLFGYTGEAHPHEFFEYLGDVPVFARGLTPMPFAVAGCCLVLLFVLGALQKHSKFLKVVPPQLIAVLFGVILGQVVGLGSLDGGRFLIKLPEQAFHGFHLPDFAGLLAHKELWYAAIMGVLTLTMIDGVESLATAIAIDRIDPYHRKSQPNRVLFAMAVSNICSSLVGGLTIIPGGVKSKTNIASGGRTLWANFTNAICLIIYLAFAAKWINMIPLGALAAVLIYTGYKMCEPLIWRHMAHIGKVQLFLFSFTVLVTLLTDLLIGIFAGLGAKLVVNLVLHYRSTHIAGHAGRGLLRTTCDFFRNPVTRRELQGGVYHLYLDKPLVCFNSMKIAQEMERLPADAKSVVVHVEDGVGLIDHTACENLMEAVRDYTTANVPFEIVGLDRMRKCSTYHACAHVATPGGLAAV